MKGKYTHIELDEEERELEASFERGEWIPIPLTEEEKREYIEVAKETIRLRKLNRHSE